MNVLFFHELRLVFREPRFWMPFLLPPLVLLGLQAWAYAGSDGGVAVLFGNPQIALLVGVLLGTMTAGLAADSFAGERERETLEVLLSTPMGLHAVFFGKMAALLPLPLVLALLAQTLLWKMGGSGDAVLLWQILAVGLGVIPFLLAASMYLSLVAQTVRSAAQLGGLVIMAALIAVQGGSEWYLSSVSHAWQVLLAGWGGAAFLIALGLRRFGR